MSKKIVIIAIILIFLSFVGLNSFRNKTEPMVNPATAPLSSPEINQPKEIKYDGSTDLKQELDSVDPEVLDSDFKDL